MVGSWGYFPRFPARIEGIVVAAQLRTHVDRGFEAPVLEPLLSRCPFLGAADAHIFVTKDNVLHVFSLQSSSNIQKFLVAEPPNLVSETRWT